MTFLAQILHPTPIPRPNVIHNASPEAIARAFATRLTREFGEDASRLADIIVAQVQHDLRGLPT